MAKPSSFTQCPSPMGAIAEMTMDASFLINGLGLDSHLFEFECPVHKLPPELLSYIFWLGNCSSRESGTLPTCFAWTVAHVCGHWRQVAFSTPRLWSTFVLDLSSLRVTDQRLDSRLQFLNCCLTLSKSIPLSFVVALRTRRTGVCNAVLDSLCRHAHRWRRAFFITSTDVLASWAHLIRGNTPKLESLGFGSPDGDVGSPDLQTIFSNPSVSSLTLAGYQEESISRINVPWYQITSLKLSGCSLGVVDVLETVFRQLPNIMDLNIEGQISRSGVPFSGHMIELPRLQNLRITGYLHLVSQFLPVLLTPALCNLSMTIFKACYIRSAEHLMGIRVVDHFISNAKRVEHPIVKYIDRPYLDTLWDHLIQDLHQV